MEHVNPPESTAQIWDGENESTHRSIEYFITETLFCEENGTPAHKGYGIAAALWEEGEEKDSARMEDITCSRSEARELLQKLCKNTVTPVTLRDVVEDYLAAR